MVLNSKRAKATRRYSHNLSRNLWDEVRAVMVQVRKLDASETLPFSYLSDAGLADRVSEAMRRVGVPAETKSGRAIYGLALALARAAANSGLDFAMAEFPRD